MTAPELAESPPAARDTESPVNGRLSLRTPALIVVALTVVGLAFRYPSRASRSSPTSSRPTGSRRPTASAGCCQLLYGSGKIAHAEITPPLSFLLIWLTSRAGHSPELLRLPSLIAGTATIPVVYLRRPAHRRPQCARWSRRAHDPVAVHDLLLDRGAGVRADDVRGAAVDARRCCSRSTPDGRAGGCSTRSARAPPSICITRRCSCSRSSSCGCCGASRGAPAGDLATLSRRRSAAVASGADQRLPVADA